MAKKYDLMIFDSDGDQLINIRKIPLQEKCFDYGGYGTLALRAEMTSLKSRSLRILHYFVLPRKGDGPFSSLDA